MLAAKPVEILLVEDNPGDVCLTLEALADARIPNHVSVVDDGQKALALLRREGEYRDAKRPDLILLDLNLPGRDGREVLGIVKADENLRRIPVVVLTSSEAADDLQRSYDLHANCYVVKPVDFQKFTHAVRAIEEFWFRVVALPKR